MGIVLLEPPKEVIIKVQVEFRLSVDTLAQVPRQFVVGQRGPHLGSQRERDAVRSLHLHQCADPRRQHSLDDGCGELHGIQRKQLTMRTHSSKERQYAFVGLIRQAGMEVGQHEIDLGGGHRHHVRQHLEELWVGVVIHKHVRLDRVTFDVHVAHHQRE